MTPPVLRTRRMVLRPIEATDLDAVLDLYADPELSRYHAHDLIQPAETTALVDRRLAYRGPDGTGDWVFELDGRLIGMGHLRTSAELPGGVLECGWYLARRHWGAALGGEAAGAIRDHAHHTLAASAVFALIHQGNERALAFAGRLGFLDVGSGEHYGGPHRVLVSLPTSPAGMHHVELWVADLARAEESFGWLLTELGWREFQRWPGGVSELASEPMTQGVRERHHRACEEMT